MIRKIINFLGMNKLCISLILLLLVLTGCPAPIPESEVIVTRLDFVTLDRYEAKIGDEIIVDCGEIEVFAGSYAIYCSANPDNKELIKTEEAFDEMIILYYENEETENLELVEKISNSKAKFRIPQNAVSSSIKIKMYSDYKQDETSCREKDVKEDEVCRVLYSDKPLTITQ